MTQSLILKEGCRLAVLRDMETFWMKDEAVCGFPDSAFVFDVEHIMEAKSGEQHMAKAFFEYAGEDGHNEEGVFSFLMQEVFEFEWLGSWFNGPKTRDDWKVELEDGITLHVSLEKGGVKAIFVKEDGEEGRVWRRWKTQKGFFKFLGEHFTHPWFDMEYVEFFLSDRFMKSVFYTQSLDQSSWVQVWEAHGMTEEEKASLAFFMQWLKGDLSEYRLVWLDAPSRHEGEFFDSLLGYEFIEDVDLPFELGMNPEGFGGIDTYDLCWDIKNDDNEEMNRMWANEESHNAAQEEKVAA